MYIADLCVRRPVFATMLISFLVVLGVFSFLDLGVDLFPKAEFPMVMVVVRLPGASPEEVNSQIVLPLEEQLSTISGLDELNSTAQEGSARVHCRFVLERDMEDAAQDVREKVSLAISRFPPGVQPPVIRKMDPDAAPILQLVVAGQRDLREITEIAEKQVKRALETVDGVAGVDVVGGRAREIIVELDAEKLNAQSLTIQQVRDALQRENVDIPGGQIVQGSNELTLRTEGRVNAVGEFSDIVVTTRRGFPLKISDLGQVKDSFQQPRSFAHLDGKSAVTLMVRRQSGTNTVKIVDQVREKLRQIERTLPSGLSLQVIQDQSQFIRASVQALEEHLLLGSLFASLVILLFIRNLRSVLIASVAIPTSIIATFTVMRGFDFTLNSMTLLALTLAVGIVIDDAIVVLENIFRYVEELKYKPRLAAVEATREIGLAVMATTLSLVIIFVPVAFMTGFAARYLNAFGWTMASAILVSLLVSFTLTPMLSSRFLREIPEGSEGPHGGSKKTAFFAFLERRYLKALGWALNHRLAIVALSLLVFLSTFPLAQRVGRDWIPTDDRGEFMIHLDVPEGTSVEGTQQVSAQIEPLLSRLPGVAHVLSSTGERVTHLHISVQLVPPEQRPVNQFEVADLAREALQNFPKTIYRISFVSALGGGEFAGFPINLNLRGPDLQRLGTLALRAADEMRKLPGFGEVEASFYVSSPELKVRVDRERAADLGVRISDVAGALRLMISGEDEITTYREAGEQYPVKMRVLEEQRTDPKRVASLMVPSSRLGLVRVDSVAQIERGLGPTRIPRFNRQYVVGISAALAQGTPLDQAARQTQAILDGLELPAGYDYRFGGQVKALEETTRNLVLAFLLASIFMYMVLAAQFESFVHPFIIMLALPLSVPFALLSLYLTGRTLNLWSTLGVLLLLGIVKKNSILQVDYTNRLRARGMNLRDALMEANRARLRPILMTTFAIVAGLIPTALGGGSGAAQRSAIAITIIGGQMLCLFLTLLLTPVAYSLQASFAVSSLAARFQLGLMRLRTQAGRALSSLL
ncbi:MAG: efflux RND transporter permease subunit [Acidobacteria bacterium]|nr:efflux RND transporter permease subunit [Acidobacteriota bacterium]